jgi:hypothetical protein
MPLSLIIVSLCGTIKRHNKNYLMVPNKEIIIRDNGMKSTYKSARKTSDLLQSKTNEFAAPHLIRECNTE